MTYFVVKTLITALIVAGISELARRYSLLAAALASLPITSILAFVWLYHDTRNVAEISTLSYNILWLIAPSLLFFVALPFLLETGLRFYPALIISCVLMSAAYGLMLAFRQHFIS